MKFRRRRRSSRSGSRRAATAGTRTTTPSTPRYAAAISTSGAPLPLVNYRHGRPATMARWRSSSCSTSFPATCSAARHEPSPATPGPSRPRAAPSRAAPMRGSSRRCWRFSTCRSCIRSIWRTSSAASSCFEIPRRTSNTPGSMPTSSAGSAASRTATIFWDEQPRPKNRLSWMPAAFPADDMTAKRRCRFRQPEYCTGRPPGLRHPRPFQGETTMTIQVGDKLPEAKFRVMTAEGPQVKTTDDIFKGKKVALFAVPGAYTGTCHKMHLPSIFLNAYAIKNKGVDTIAIVSVNDAFVMNAWKRDTDQRDEAVFLADGNADFTKAIGMELDASGNGLGIRSKRYSMLVDNGVVKKFNIEPAPGKVEVSGGDTLLAQL